MFDSQTISVTEMGLKLIHVSKKTSRHGANRLANNGTTTSISCQIFVFTI